MQIYEKDVELIENLGSNGVENTFNWNVLVFCRCMVLKYIL